VKRDADLTRARQSGGCPVDVEHPFQERNCKFGGGRGRFEDRVYGVAPGLRFERLDRRLFDDSCTDLEKSRLEQRRERVVQATVAGKIGEDLE